ncbi:MAG: 3-deoxy-D-manno-octulosonic acid transferase [Blastocatellia bacterium]|nr:3-deoxy-D-manno-octulosonic acid transferase [Blastocatellia bacterium]
MRGRRYSASLLERLAFRSKVVGSEPNLLIHCVSVGEFLAAEPLIIALKQALPRVRLIVSTTTYTAQALACERVSAYAEVCYFPLDLGFAVERFLSAVKPIAVLIVETELWPNFLRAARNRSIPVIVVSGRLSDRSFMRYRLVKRLFARVLNCVDLFLVQSERDAKRFLALGAQRVEVCGNIKYDLGTAEQLSVLDRKAEVLDRLLRLDSQCPLIVAGSTVPGEEELLLNAFDILSARIDGLRLLIAPRRPERFEQVAKLLSGRQFVRRSRLSEPLQQEPQLILLDSIGELAAVYRFATVVFVGGSLVPYGGHNVLEPALYGKAILTGPYVDNFRSVIKDFVDAEALVCLETVSVEQLASELERLLADAQLRMQLGENARKLMDKNRGAVLRHIERIRSVLGG